MSLDKLLPQAPRGSSRLGWQCSLVVELSAEHVKGPRFSPAQQSFPHLHCLLATEILLCFPELYSPIVEGTVLELTGLNGHSHHV